MLSRWYADFSALHVPSQYRFYSRLASCHYAGERSTTALVCRPFVPSFALVTHMQVGYNLANQTAYLDDTLRWGLDWLMKVESR